MKRKWTGFIFYFLPMIIGIPSIFIAIHYLLKDIAGLEEWIALVISSIALALLLFIFSKILDAIGDSTSKSVRKIAMERSIEIEERTRPITFYDVDPKYFEEAPVVCYGLRYRDPQTTTWSLHLPESLKGDFPNGWNLIVKKGEITEATRNLISTIAGEIAENKKLLERNIEIDSLPDKVWLAFGETNNAEVVNRVFDILKRISENPG